MNFTDRELIDYAGNCGARLGDRSDDIESARRLPADIATDLAQGGLFHAVVPREYGGSEAHPSTVVEVIKRVSEWDGSAGWNVMIGITTGLLAASLPDEFAREIYGESPGGLAVGVTAPLGRAEIVEGGYRVSGRWPFGSGSDNAGWIAGGCFLYENGEQRTGGKGQPEHHLMMFRRDQVEIEDNWHVSGLCGTGSHHFNVSDVFVPAGRSVAMGGRPRFDRAVYQFPMLGLLAMGVSSVSLGLGYRALAAFKELAASKVQTGANRGLDQQSRIQLHVAESTAELESAEAYMHKVIDDAWHIASRGERLPVEAKAKLRLAAANTTRQSVAAIDRLYHAGGGSSIYQDNVLQRCFRDVHVSTQHLMVAESIWEVVGRVELGLDPRSMV